MTEDLSEIKYMQYRTGVDVERYLSQAIKGGSENKNVVLQMK